jgi:hypothetical protein
MPKRNPTPDLIKPVIVGGIFLVLAVTVGGIFMLLNTRMLQSISTVPDLDLPKMHVSTDLVSLKATVTVDAREGWQTTNIFIEKGASIEVSVVDGEWTEWKGIRPYTSGRGSDYICAKTKPAECCLEPAPDASQGALIGKLDSQILRIGEGATFTAEHSGTLLLRMNDPDVGLYDNDGSLEVEVVIE